MKPIILGLMALLSTITTQSWSKSVSGSAILQASQQGLVFSSIEETQQNVSDKLVIVAVGDVLLHRPLHEQALKHPYGHQSLWINTIPWIKNADIAYANIEGPVAPGVLRSGRVTADPGNHFDNNVYTSYPQFNYHQQLIGDLKASGFDVVSTANNHSLDRGSRGVDATIENLRHYGLAFTGTRTKSETENPATPWFVIVEQKGYRIAWLACSYGTNGLSDRYHQVLGCFSDRKEILNLIRSLSKDRSIDAVIVTPHVGEEYEDLPRANAIELYRSFLDAGAIAIIGSHPHVLQPWEKHVTPDGREGFILYSLGNFVSGQFHKVKTRASILLALELNRDSHGRTVIEKVQYLPLEMTRHNRNYTLKVLRQNSGSPELLRHIESMFGTANQMRSPVKLEQTIN